MIPSVQPDHTAVIQKAISALGHDRISPESLTALRQSVYDWGMKGTAQKAGIPADEFEVSYIRWMDMMQQMFAPVDRC